MGSVKDLKTFTEITENSPEPGRFDFSNRYSIFDYGEMPDHIDRKGAALCMMAAYNFEELKKQNIDSHYLGLEDDHGQTISLEEMLLKGRTSNKMVVLLAQKFPPHERKFLEDGKKFSIYDYAFYERNRGNVKNMLIPLEIIYRNGLPKGSSVFKRIRKAQEEGNDEKLENILSELGLTEIPQENSMLPKPVVGYTTKLEASDRKLDYREAYRISGLQMRDFDKATELALKVNDFLNTRSRETGLGPHWDGKIEAIYTGSDIILADVVGTLDENRFGEMVSKELLRQWYIKNQPDFEEDCLIHKESGEGWQETCPTKPANLPSELKHLVSEMYQSATNQWLKKNVFHVSQTTQDILERLKSFLN